MTRFDKFCNLILEVYGKRVDVPDDGRAAADRYNNPGGAYPKQSFEKFGMQGYGIIGGGNPIAKYPDLPSGIAANMEHLRTMPIVGKTVGEARYYWVNGNFGGSMPLEGMDSNQVITQEMLTDPNWLGQWMRATAKAEGFNKTGRTIGDSDIAQAMNILQNKSSFTPSAQYASTGQAGSTQPPAPSEQKGESPSSGLFSDILAPLAAGGFTKEAGLKALGTVLGTAATGIEQMAGKKIPSLAKNQPKDSSTKFAKNDVDAFLGNGRWKETPEREKEINKFLGEV